MKTGTDRIEGEIKRFIKRGEHVALLCNQASVNQKFEHIIDIVLRAGIKPVYIFSPEHGLYGVFQDMIEVKEDYQYKGIPVFSLYGDNENSLYPDESLLENIDTLIVDLFDIGTRFYTFAATMLLFMQRAYKRVKFVICDRPNPIGGIYIEGNGVDDAFRSFVGLIDLPVRHSLTLGEIALYFKDISKLDINVKIIKVTGYTRDKYLDDYSYNFIPPSPNMPSLNTAFVYPMGCLFEGTNLSEGRGTTRPFEIFGADFIDPFVLSKELNKLKIDGAYFRPIYFMPKFHKYRDKTIGGIFVHITDRRRFRPYITGIMILYTIRRLYGERLKWRIEPYEFVSDRLAIDLLFGTDKIRHMIDNQEGLSTIIDFVREGEMKLRKRIKNYYVYPQEIHR